MGGGCQASDMGFVFFGRDGSLSLLVRRGYRAILLASSIILERLLWPDYSLACLKLSKSRGALTRSAELKLTFFCNQMTTHIKDTRVSFITIPAVFTDPFEHGRCEAGVR